MSTTIRSWQGGSIPNIAQLDLQRCFSPQQCAIVHLSSGPMASQLPLQRAYLSTLRSHKSLETHNDLRLYTCSHTCIFFLTFSVVVCSYLVFSFLLFSDSSHLCSPICPYCPKFDFQTSFGYPCRNHPLPTVGHLHLSDRIRILGQCMNHRLKNVC